MRGRPRRTASRAPFAWAIPLHFANAKLTAKNWEAVLLKPLGMRPTPGLPPFGFTSLEQVEPILVEFRRVFGQLVNAPSVEAVELSDILAIINSRAQGVLKKWTWVQRTGRVFPRIETKNNSFEEGLYAQLATAMTGEPFTVVKQCRQCERFFYEPRRSTARLCSAPCRARDARARAERYREEHKDEYREYQRRLMAKRRREEKA
jgi:hypothetical protein